MSALAAEEVGGVLGEIRYRADNGGANEGQCYGWWRRLTAALATGVAP